MGSPIKILPPLLLLLACAAAAAEVGRIVRDGRPSSAAVPPPPPSQDEGKAGNAEAVRVLSRHEVVYSDPPVDAGYHHSSSRFDPRGMQHVYALSHAFLDLIMREEVLPPALNASELVEAPPERVPHMLGAEWQELTLHYVGVLTVATCGLLLAAAVPVACCCVWCCRCAGKCGAYPEHFDKRSDACKRFSLGVLLAAAVIAAMFGVVCAFVTNYFCYEGVQKLPQRLQSSTEDTSLYLGNTGKEIHSLLVTNFDELEVVLNRILDESGPILKRSLAEVTQAVAIDDLTDIVSNLGNTKRRLKEIQSKSQDLQQFVGQLRLGLNGTSTRLLSALRQCSSSKVCQDFLSQYNISRDLAIAANFSELPTRLPDLSLLMQDISQLMENDIESKVRGGQEQLDRVKVDIERSIGDIRPKIKAEIRRMGDQLSDQAAEIQRFLNELDGHVASVGAEAPALEPRLEEYSEYHFYIGLGMSFMLLLILVCYVFGLFYGFCGKRPDNAYGDDCCNTGTGANWLLAAVYLTFLFSFVLLVVATAQFLVGSTADKVVCDALKRPNDSDIFQLLDRRLVQPVLEEQKPHERWSSVPVSQLIADCHRNLTIYEILRVEDVYDVTELRRWREQYGIGDFIANLKRKIRLEDLRSIQILSPEAEAELRELAESQISDLNFSQYTKLLEEKITSIDLGAFTGRLRQVRERLGRQQARLVGPAIQNEALFLDQMQRVVVDMKLTIRELDNAVRALEREARHTKPNLSEALRSLIEQATKATRFLREEGPQLVDKLADQYVNETVALIDAYVERVVNGTRGGVGRCEPLSNSYNATVIAVCNQIVDPFNGIWTSVGWCLLFFLPSIVVALALVSLYRKAEPYPGPLVEAIPSDEALHMQHQPGGRGGGRGGGRNSSSGGKKKRGGRGHRRNHSAHLPETAHYRAGYSYQDRENRFRDIAPRNSAGAEASSSVAGGASAAGPSRHGAAAAAASSGAAGPGGGQVNPPRYSSNPSLDLPAVGGGGGGGAGPPPAEYERPPPYYYPGSAPAGDAPPPLPAPNRQ